MGYRLYRLHYFFPSWWYFPRDLLDLRRPDNLASACPKRTRLADIHFHGRGHHVKGLVDCLPFGWEYSRPLAG